MQSVGNLAIAMELNSVIDRFVENEFNQEYPRILVNALIQFNEIARGAVNRHVVLLTSQIPRC